MAQVLSEHLVERQSLYTAGFHTALLLQLLGSSGSLNMTLILLFADGISPFGTSICMYPVGSYLLLKGPQ